ncbi:hypothetical protein HELRODRAFT_85956, partial [Helobdella robusta]|uniref:Antistasin-like domain-containing protein n=1 Tax=Helobdella robusta TaxID=6412 RepID=T1G649_HELRO
CDDSICARGCPSEYEYDHNGCRKCLCKGCSGRQCRMRCPLGFTTDEQGCQSFCTCNTEETVCKNIWCTAPRVCNPRNGRCGEYSHFNSA